MGKRSSSRGGDGSRGQSSSRRSSGEQQGKKEQGSISLLVRNIAHDCGSDLLDAFQKFGRIRDFYIPKDYHSGEPRGFAFVEYWDSCDASYAQRRMNRKMVCGREINVVPAVGKRKRPDDLSRRTGVRGHSVDKGCQLSRHGRLRSRSLSRSPRRGGRDRSRSHSPAPRRRRDYSASPKRKEDRQTKSSGHSKEDDKGKKQEPCTPIDRSDRHDADNDSIVRRETPDYSVAPKRMEDYHKNYPREAKKHDEDKRQRSYTSADRNDCREDRDGHNERVDYSTSPKRKEERLPISPRLSKEHDKDKKWRSYSRDDGNGSCDADIGLKERRVPPDNGSPKRTEELRQAKSQSQSNENDNDKNQRSYTRDDGKDRSNADIASKERNDYSASGNKKEEERVQNFRRQSKEHDENKKRGSCTPGDRSEYHDNDNGSKERRHDNSASRKRMKEHHAKSPRQSKEHENDKKRGSYAHDTRKGHCDDNGSRERHDYSASRNGKEERRAKSPRQSKEHDDSKKRGSFTPGDRNDHHDTDNGSKKQDDNSATRKRMEDHRAKSPRQSKEYENDKKMGSYTRDDRKDRCDAENGSRERRDDHSASRKRMEDHRSKSPRQSKEHESDKKRGSYIHDDRKDGCGSDNGSREMRDGYVASRKRKEECRGKSPRQSKEHDENRKSGSYAPDDRNDAHDADNGCSEKLATPDGEGSHQRSPRPSSGSRQDQGTRLVAAAVTDGTMQV